MVKERLINTLIILLLLFSIFAVSSFSSSAQVIRVASNVDVTWSDEQTEKPVIPRNEVRSLNLSIKYWIDWGGDLSRGVFDGYIDAANALVLLTIVDHSPWVSAALEVDTVPIRIPAGIGEGTNHLYMQLSDDAPAYGEGFITIEAHVRNMQLIESITKEFTLDFIAAYFPRIAVNLPETNTKQISPMESAVFPIEIENLGNARTRVFLDVNRVAEGWTVAVTDDVALDEGEGSKATAYLPIKPPKGIGYHYDEGVFQVILTPARAENLLDTGDSLIQTFIIQSEGFSTPGFEFIPLLGALIVVFLLITLKRKYTE